MSNKLIAWSIAKPVKIYIILAILTFSIGGLISQIKVDTDPENMLSTEDVDRLYHNKVKKEFSLNDIIVIGAIAKNNDSIYNSQSLTDLKQLTDSILKIEGVVVKDVNSLSTIDNIEQQEEGNIRFDWLMQSPPKDTKESKILDNKASRLPFVVDSLVSGDKKAATIYVPIIDKNESYRISGEIADIIEQLSTVNDYHITGLPVAEDTFGVEMFIQMGISAPAAALVIYLLMLYFFRSATLVVAPMVVAMSTVIIIMGAMIGMGYTVHIMSSMIPIFLMPIAVVDSVHVMSEFVDHYKPGQDAKKEIQKVTENLFRPMLFTSVTSAAGFFSLALTPIPPVQIFGMFVGIGILLAFIITIVFIPAYVSRMSQENLIKMQNKLHSGDQSNSLIAKILPSWGRFSLANSKMIVLGALVIIGFSIVGIYKIQINDNPVRWFKSDHKIRVADKVLNEHFAGTYDAHLVLEFSQTKKLIKSWKENLLKNKKINTLNKESQIAIKEKIKKTNDLESLQQAVLLIDDLSFSETEENTETLNELLSITENTIKELKFFTSPKNLEFVEQLQKFLLTTNKVGKSTSINDLIKTVNRELRSGEDKDFVLPETQAGVSQALLQYQSSHRPHDLWHFVTPDYQKSLVWLQMTSGDNQDMSVILNAVNDYLAAADKPEGLEVHWAGKAYLNLVWQEKMVAGMFDSLISAFVIVFLMMVFLFRSIIFGLLAMLPLTITILFMYGMIGWMGKNYDMPIAVLSALTLGLSVDFAIHFIERTRASFEKNKNWLTTIQEMFAEPARAITRNALVIALGFTPLLLAPLVPYITVGAFLATIMAVSCLVTLFVLPASMQLICRKYFNIS